MLTVLVLPGLLLLVAPPPLRTLVVPILLLLVALPTSLILMPLSRLLASLTVLVPLLSSPILILLATVVLPTAGLGAAALAGLPLLGPLRVPGLESAALLALRLLFVPPVHLV